MTGPSEPRVPDPRVNPGRTQPNVLYRCLLRLLSPLLLAHVLWIARRDGGWRYVRERFGYLPHSNHPERWLHGASVGEIITLLPVIEGLRRREPDTLILVTSNTPTSAGVLQRYIDEHRLAGIRHAYLPLDWPGSAGRFLDRTRLQSGWILETEIWPWLFARCQARQIPLTIFNARVSARTSRHEQGIGSATYRRALHTVRVLARSDDDQQAYVRLGADPDHCKTIGDLKYASAQAGTRPTHRLLEQNYCIAASTHADEEIDLAKAWLDSNTERLLVLAPRHPQRGKRLSSELRKLTPLAQRSAGEPLEAHHRLYLADTLGELPALYAHADAVFVGGSLVSRGGHNVLEPARFGKAMVVGPSVYNFQSVVDRLLNQDALIQVPSAQAAVAQLQLWAEQPVIADTVGSVAREVANRYAAIADRYLDELLAGTANASR